MKPSPLWHPSAVIGSPPEHAAWVAGASRFGEALQPSYAPEVSRTARLSAFVTIDSGCKRPTEVGDEAIVMAHVHIGHDCLVGERVHLAPHTTLGGFSEVHDDAHVGIGATVLPFRIVGEGATVGAGAVVTKDVEPGTTVAGNPARRVDRNVVPFTDRRMAA